MKKNLILFGVLLGLLVVTYVVQEKRVAEKFEFDKVADRVLTEEVTHLKLPNVEAEKRGGQWWAGPVLLSHNNFKLIERKLSEVKKLKDITGKFETFFPHPVSFEVNRVKWTVGDLSLDRQSFYLAKDGKLLLAVIEGDSQQLTDDETQIAAIKLNELVSAVSKPLAELKENQLFRFYPKLPLERVVVSSEGTVPYELNFKTNTTTPPPLPGITVHDELRSKFLALLTQATVRAEVPFTEKLAHRLAEVKFHDGTATRSFELWLKNKSSADAYVVDPLGKKAFLMVGGTLKFFFIQLQDYWDKKVIPPKEFKHFTKLSLRFTQGPKAAAVTLVNSEPLGYEVRGFKVDAVRMEQLMQFLLNLGARDQAERISALSPTEKQQLLNQSALRIEVLNQELLLWRKAEELIVVNLTQGFKAHFNLLDENFHGTFEDVLK